MHRPLVCWRRITVQNITRLEFSRNKHLPQWEVGSVYNQPVRKLLLECCYMNVFVDIDVDADANITADVNIAKLQL